MKKTWMAPVTAVLFFLLASSAYAGVLDIPDGDPFATLLNLVLNWSAVAPFAKAVAVIVFLVQALKKFAPGFQYLRTVVIVGGVVAAILQSIASGMTIQNAVVFVLLTSGGAIAIYELFKTPINTIFQVKQ